MTAGDWVLIGAIGGWLVLAAAVALWAGSKGYPFLVSLLFAVGLSPIVAVLIVALLPDRTLAAAKVPPSVKLEAELFRALEKAERMKREASRG